MKHKIIAGIPIRDGGWIIEKTLDVLSRFCEKIVIVNDNSKEISVRWVDQRSNRCLSNTYMGSS